MDTHPAPTGRGGRFRGRTFATAALAGVTLVLTLQLRDHVIGPHPGRGRSPRVGHLGLTQETPAA